MLKIEGIHKSFNENKVLKDISLDIDNGSVFGLVGINGAGKSTLLRLIAGVYMPDDGHITLDGQDTYAQPETRKDIVFVSDEGYFPSASTIKDLKIFYESFYCLDKSLYHKYLNMFGLDENAQISSFSKGMKRQTILVFALAIKPKLLLLDECFDGLDPLARLNFKKALIDLIEERDITIIISSHNLKELEDICDSFGILENGQINTYGDLQESKDRVAKFQLAYSDNAEHDFRSRFEVLSEKKEGRVITLVVKGDVESIRKEIAETDPLIMDELPVNFEELFIYEVESRGMLNE